MRLIAESIEFGENGWVVWFAGTTDDNWQRLYPFNKQNGEQTRFREWADEVGIDGFKVEPDHIRFKDETDATIALIAWKGIPHADDR